ncbi:UDP-4-amino-4,6-dideoxy-N-acetyl-beta-L-altrosamine N-acetyltransferase [Desulfofundulus thermocisternus]|uniref:UDP-4-amino-4, 6-dideoxy-N-acetyl-beta-L-altrosamine N-acetyltransferase n=1 Tax=Desulfofundulus thermocisternus TaxID=42471 RepID=UPI00217DC778|nr:UDP-4-amino-4,6-dideoxy-N-acetyl-beta-L-altrosamine N-acetyltransferase [Desulfofundulus thermocisternus]MCS5696644.1 UDP-4-amino-4,6-dideoxy-N-acetyl-beta-L-altrosamine N-acetyltransferase [Desulfofundulus thermocisternus]
MIKLRKVELNDKEKVRQWRNLPHVAKYMYTDHYITPEEHEKWFEMIMKDPSVSYWIIVYNERDVGLAGIYNIDRRNSRCYWAFYIADQDIRGKGLGSYVEYFILHYVFDVLKLNKLCCEVLAFNENVIHMHKSFGFKQEGLFRQHIIKNGQPIDVICLAMLHEEWELLKSEIEGRLRKKGLLTD